MFLDHMRDRLLSWEGLGSQTIEEPSKYLQFKIDKVMTLIQDISDPAIEQITKEDQLTMVSLIIMRLLKEFAVEIAWKGENRYEGTRAPLNSHEDLYTLPCDHRCFHNCRHYIHNFLVFMLKTIFRRLCICETD